MALNQFVTRLLRNRKNTIKNIFKPSGYRLQFTNNGNYWYDNVLYKKRTLSNIYTEELHIHYKIRRQDNIYNKLRTENSLLFN